MSGKTSRGRFFLNLSQTDLPKLQRQHRRVVGAKRAYMKQTRSLIIRDEQEIQWLQDKNEELSHSLGAYQGWSHGQTDVRQDLTAKLAHRDRLDEKLEAEKLKAASLRDQIAEWEKKLMEQKSRGTINHNRKFKNHSLLKTSYLTENKIDKEHKCLNELMTKNEELREEVKTQQIERKKFLHVKLLLEKELHTVHKNMSYLTSKCTQVFNDSVEIRGKQKVLTDQNAKDFSQYDRGRINLERKLSHYQNTVAFSDIKDAERISQNTDHKTVEKKSKNETKEWELKDFIDAITKIIAETEKYNLDNLVRDFIQTEEKSYVLLTFINSQDCEVETIQKRISQLHSERDVLEAEEQQQHRKIQTQNSNISNKQEAADQQLAVFKEQDTCIEKLLDHLKKGLTSSLQSCYRSSELGSVDNIQNENIMQYLAMMEDRLNELFTLHSHHHLYKNLSSWDTGTLSTTAASILGINPQMSTTSTAAVKPVMCHDSDPVESDLLEENEPMSKEVLLSLIRKKSQWRKKTN